MKVTFYSNYMNHHQLYLSKAFVEKGVDYTFVATTPISQERLELGYENMDKKYDFVLTTYDSDENYKKALELAIDSDIVIIGSASNDFIKERIKQNKIIFRYSERIFKKDKVHLINIIKSRIKNILLREHNTYLLCSSAYVAKDYEILGRYKNKAYKWGYFPECIEYDINDLLDKKDKEVVKLLWVGRFIEWKHPELAVNLAEYLVSKDITNFEINMLGNGELLEKVKNIVKTKQLEKHIKILGAVPSHTVRSYMEESAIHIFTSDQNEGWGAVLNESMNSACAVVANKLIGSVPYLIKNEVNGFYYENESEFLELVEKLILNKELRNKIANQAYLTIKNIWNSDVAVNNLLKLYDGLKVNKNEDIIKYGPGSKDIEYL